MDAALSDPLVDRLLDGRYSVTSRLARAIAGATLTSHDGLLLGTAAYLAPEQVRALHVNLGLDDVTPYAPVHALGHPFGQMISFGGMVFNGVFDKFPNVKFGFMEGGVAWFLVCMERFDRSWETHIQQDPRNRFLELRPKEKVSEYIARHVDAGRIFVGCEGEEPDIAHAIKRIGNKPWVYSSDYPHEVNNEFCKHEINEFLENQEIGAADKVAFLHGNARRFYNLGAAGL